MLARLQRPNRGERVPVIRRRDDDGVDILVVEHASEILRLSTFERDDVAQSRVVDPLWREIRIDVAERLDLDVLEPREAALQRVALPADAYAGRDDAIIGADDSAAHVGRRVKARTKELAAECHAGGSRPDACAELTPCEAVRIVSLFSHSCSSLSSQRIRQPAWPGIPFLRK